MFKRLFSLFLLTSCFSCMWQYNPRPDWAIFKKESTNANRSKLYLAADGTIPVVENNEVQSDNPIASKYQTYCATCHGKTGAGDGPGAAGLVPAPRNLKDKAWRDLIAKDKSRAVKVIKLGAAAAGVEGVKSASMAPWGSILSDQEIDEIVDYILTL